MYLLIFSVSTEQPQCMSDLECPQDRSCISQRCQDPCNFGSPCGTEAECIAIQHRAVCRCPDGWGGNPQVQCYKRMSQIIF